MLILSIYACRAYSWLQLQRGAIDGVHGARAVDTGKVVFHSSHRRGDRVFVSVDVVVRSCSAPFCRSSSSMLASNTSGGTSSEGSAELTRTLSASERHCRLLAEASYSAELQVPPSSLLTARPTLSARCLRAEALCS